jgi:hypothetical protein
MQTVKKADNYHFIKVKKRDDIYINILDNKPIHLN